MTNHEKQIEVLEGMITEKMRTLNPRYILINKEKIVEALTYFINLKQSQTKIYCKKCYDKGYSTEMIGKTIARGDFIGDKDKVIAQPQIVVHLCSCDRGRQIDRYFVERSKQPKRRLSPKKVANLLFHEISGANFIANEKLCNRLAKALCDLKAEIDE